VGAVDAAVESVAEPPSEPSFVQEVPEILEGMAVRETCGVGTAALAVGMKK